MVRTVSNRIEDEETHDSSSPTESKRGDRKINPSRTKHSETEQRRRSKINERFQMLRELIPENDQKRDKASFLLEVIHYVQFLKEKLQIYEGSSQEWSPDPAKCYPLRMNSGPVESFVDQSQFDRNFIGHEDNVLDTALLSNAQNMPPIFQGVAGQPYQGSFPDTEQVGHQTRAPLWPGRSCGDDCSIPIYAANKDKPKSESGEASLSSVYSQGLLSSLKNSLQSSGVDLSQASISVQLDIGKRTTGESTNTMFYFKDDENGSSLDYGAPMNINENYEQPPKRFRANQT
ncbi:hypothetical protein CASFOL_018827 [Castilleja foliolosa]|uniref:BHLH domain-containing protein n=1 Tax=Castilleja foliolosa TaxID=1961234 RepID=A0ABD3D3E3_9LAMI